MSNQHNQQDTILKEANDLLETAQKEVLREINTKRNFISRIFAGEDTSDSLKQAQSSISKAINQMKNFSKDESSLIIKLQNHLNEKSSTIKRLEEDFATSQQETSDLRDKVKFYEEEIERVKTEKAQEAQDKAHNDHKLEEELKAKIKEIESVSKEIEEKFSATKEELVKSQELSVELSGRMKRLKAEITNK